MKFGSLPKITHCGFEPDVIMFNNGWVRYSSRGNDQKPASGVILFWVLDRIKIELFLL